MQGSARKDVVFGAARVYTATVPGPKWKSWLGVVIHTNARKSKLQFGSNQVLRNRALFSFLMSRGEKIAKEAFSGFGRVVGSSLLC